MTDTSFPIALTLTDGCLCKALRYSVSGAPIASRGCWRRDCQYFAAGSAIVDLIFNVSDLKLTGKLKVFTSQADSGNMMQRGFCPRMWHSGDERIVVTARPRDPARRHARSYRDRNACHEHLDCPRAVMGASRSANSIGTSAAATAPSMR